MCQQPEGNCPRQMAGTGRPVRLVMGRDSRPDRSSGSAEVMRGETRYDETQSVVQEPVSSGSEVHMFSPITKWRSISRRTTFVIAVALCACGLLGARPAMAARLHHVELNVADPQAAAAWYVEHMGAKAIGGKGAAVAFGPTTIQFAKAAQPVAGSVGTGLDHIGFGYADIDAAMKRFAQTGVTIVSGVEQEGPIRYAFIKDPWGTLIEIVQDADLQGFHHVHLATTDGKQTLKWYRSEERRVGKEC